MNTLKLVLVLCLLGSAWSLPALAQTEDGAEGDAPGLGAETTLPTDDAARALFERGNAAFNVGQYGEAAEHFRAAYELSNHAELLYNIYSALEREGGHLEEATDALEQYLQAGTVPEDRYAPLNARLQRMRARLAEQRADEAQANVHNQEIIAPVQPDEPEAGGVHPAATALLITAGALAVSFGVFAALSASEDGSLDDSCATSCDDDEVSTLRTYNLIADISWITALAAGATGVVLLFTLKNGGDDEESASLSPWAAPGAAGATLTGSF